MSVASLVAQAAARLAYLRLAPADAEVRAEVVRLAGALVAHADRESWPALGALAGPLVRLLATRRGDAPVLDALEQGLAAIEVLIDKGLAHA